MIDVISLAFTGSLQALSDAPLLQAVLAGLATFVLEDAAALACAALVASGRMDLAPAFLGLAVGIAAGDLGLHLLGRALGPKLVTWGVVRRATLDEAARRFERGAVLALAGSRFVPGLRLPTYLASGIVGARLSIFLPVVISLSVAWVGLVLAFGERVLPSSWSWLHVLAMAGLLLVAQRLAGMLFVPRDAAPRVASRFEYWPAALFYAPIAAWYLLLALRHRSLLLPTAANPSIHAGGLIGESKSDVLSLVRGDARRFVLPFAVLDVPASCDPTVRARAARERMRAAGLELPIVVKPDRGQRGLGVARCDDDAQLAAHLARFPAGTRVMLQRLAPAPDEAAHAASPERLRSVVEAGILWWRDPETGRSEILSLTLKRLPEVTGDGRSTLRELVTASPRARLKAGMFLSRHAAHAERVLARGESFPLAFTGNHCQGAIFLDGAGLVTPELLARCDEIAGAMPGFCFGRIDARFRDPEAFLRGEDLAIVEINGAGAEATHVWDPGASLLRSWLDLCRQWSILFRIGAAQRARGARPVGIARFLADVRDHRRLVRALEAA